MNKELKEQAHKEFDERFKCIQGDCDGNGHIPEQISEDEWTSHQCQFHAEYIFPIKSFIDSLIDKTVQTCEERIVRVIDGMKAQNLDSLNQKDTVNIMVAKILQERNNTINEIISLITNKSDINKDKE